MNAAECHGAECGEQNRFRANFFARNKPLAFSRCVWCFMASSNMATYKEQPLPLITLQNGVFQVGNEALNVISSIKDDIAIVAVAGLYRFVSLLKEEYK
jgi:hypothetical protein